MPGYRCAAARWQVRAWRHGDGRWPGRPQDHRRRGDQLVPSAYGCPDDGSVNVWAAGTCPGRLPVKIHVSWLKYSWPGCCGHGLARHRTVRIGYLMYLPRAQLGVQSLTFRTPLPKATECQLVHVRPLTSSLEGMQPMSYPAGRTWPWPLQLTSTTWLDPADAGPAASTTPPAVPAMATRAPASATRARMSLIELPAFRSWVPITL